MWQRIRRLHSQGSHQSTADSVLEGQVIRRVGGIRDMKVNVRVIAAWNGIWKKAVRDRELGQDFYYRLAIIAIFIPPLRDPKRRRYASRSVSEYSTVND
jgi:transcriptional regulator with PAS, ATPase and Fis domain